MACLSLAIMWFSFCFSVRFGHLSSAPSKQTRLKCVFRALGSFHFLVLSFLTLELTTMRSELHWNMGLALNLATARNQNRKDFFLCVCAPRIHEATAASQREGRKEGRKEGGKG